MRRDAGRGIRDVDATFDAREREIHVMDARYGDGPGGVSV
jgi:hypothetical protein